jgi:phytoene/squalene synthetase
MSQATPQLNALQSELKNPILDIAASFWDDERYRAFRVCYQSMRQLDDIVDDLKIAGLAENPDLRAEVKHQLAKIIQLLQSQNPEPSELRELQELQELRETMKRFRIPLAPWLKLASSMEFDLEHSGFESFLQFTRYAKGAAVAPASVFIHLIGLSSTNRGYQPAPVDIFQSARPLAMFSYLTHILRDFRQDAEEGLEYFPSDARRHYDISETNWRLAAEGAQTAGFTAMIRHYHSLADRYRLKSIVEKNPVYPFLDEATCFSLHLIWDLYSQIHELIAEADFVLEPKLIHPSKDAVFQRVMRLAKRMNVSDEILKRGLKRVGLNEVNRTK